MMIKPLMDFYESRQIVEADNTSFATWEKATEIAEKARLDNRLLVSAAYYIQGSHLQQSADDTDFMVKEANKLIMEHYYPRKQGI